MAKKDVKEMKSEGRWCFGCARPLIGPGAKGEKDDPQFLKVLLLGSGTPTNDKNEAFWPDVEPFRIVKKERKSNRKSAEGAAKKTRNRKSEAIQSGAGKS
mmetsp:Transcript_36429/g.67303  ORF Transcript_36429/g.67303 Transcript_36429/m.67303 type:complete len:100 (-) Transcript_36429:129-428(-)